MIRLYGDMPVGGAYPDIALWGSLTPCCNASMLGAGDNGRGHAPALPYPSIELTRLPQGLPPFRCLALVPLARGKIGLITLLRNARYLPRLQHSTCPRVDRWRWRCLLLACFDGRRYPLRRFWQGRLSVALPRVAPWGPHVSRFIATAWRGNAGGHAGRAGWFYGATRGAGGRTGLDWQNLINGDNPAARPPMMRGLAA